MINQKEENLVVTASHQFEESEFAIKASAEAFEILSSGLYQDKVAAVIREISTNCVDGHKQHELGLKAVDGSWLVAPRPGQSKVPFDVQLPTALDPVFKVRDYGTGLQQADVFNLYTTYFGSTKTDSNDFVGALGLGSKSPFSLTTSFMVVSFFNGNRAVYTAMLGENGFPTIKKLHDAPTSEPNGMEISFTVDRENISLFADRAQKIYTFFDVKPKITGAKCTIPERKYTSQSNGWGVRNDYLPVGAVMGNICYAISLSALQGKIDKSVYSFYQANANNLELNFDIGQVRNSASRETLSYTPSTIKSIEAKLKSIMEEIGTEIIKDVAAQTSYIDALSKLYTYENDQSRRHVRDYLISKGEVKYNNKPISSYLSLKFEVTQELPWVERKVEQTFKKINPNTLKTEEVKQIVDMSAFTDYRSPFTIYNGGGEIRSNTWSNVSSQDKTKNGKNEKRITKNEHTVTVPTSPGYVFVIHNDNNMPKYKLRAAIGKDVAYRGGAFVYVFDKLKTDDMKSFQKLTGVKDVRKASDLIAVNGLAKQVVKTLRIFHPTLKDHTNYSGRFSTSQSFSTTNDPAYLDKVKWCVYSYGSPFTFEEVIKKTSNGSYANSIGVEELDKITSCLHKMELIKQGETIVVVPSSQKDNFHKAFPKIKNLDDIMEGVTWDKFSAQVKETLNSIIWTKKFGSMNTNLDSSHTGIYKNFLDYLAKTRYSPVLTKWSQQNVQKYDAAVSKLLKYKTNSQQDGNRTWSPLINLIVTLYGSNVVDVTADVDTKKSVEEELETYFPIFDFVKNSFSPRYNYRSNQYDLTNDHINNVEVINRYVKDDWNRLAATPQMLTFAHNLKEIA